MKFLTTVVIIKPGTKTMQTLWLKNTWLKRAWGIKYIVMWFFILSSSSSLWDHQVPHKAGFGTARYHFTRCLLDLWVSKWVSNEYKSILDLWVSNEYQKPSLTIQKWKLHSTFHENVEVNGHLLAYKMKKINCKNYPDSNAINLTSVEQGLSRVLAWRKSALANCRIFDTGCYIYKTWLSQIFYYSFICLP